MTNRFFAHKKREPEEAYQVFFNALQHQSLQELVKTASLFFGVPVLLTNEHYHLLSLYPEEEIGLSLYDVMLHKRILPKELVESYQQEYLTDNTSFYEPFYADTGQVEECPRIFGEVHTEGEILGHFAVMLSDEPLYDTDLKCAGIFRDALRILMMRPRRGSFNSYSTYLQNLLDRNMAEDIRVFARNEISRIIHPGYALMATPVGRSASQHAFAAMSTSILPGNYYQVLSTISGDYLVSLFGAVKGTDSYRDSEKKFFLETAERLNRLGRSGLSRPFADLLDVPDFFKEAVLARKTGKEPLSIIYEQMPEAIFCTLAGMEDANLLLSPVLERIRAYDRENASQYYETLRVYSLCLHNKEQASDRLHIHRNTLLYRINRIVELFDLPVEENRTALYLINCFQLLEAM